MPYQITINQSSAVPKYRQIINCVTSGIERKLIRPDERLPSINEVSFKYDVSRDTVEKAYRKLKQRGIIMSVPGKGYFPTLGHAGGKRRILLLFNKLSSYKKEIFEGFMAQVGSSAAVDFQVYHEDYQLFRQLIEEKAGHYSDYVVIPSFKGQEELMAMDLLRKHLPADRLWLLNRDLPGFGQKRGAVFQHYEKDIFSALHEADRMLQKYKRLHLIFPTYSNYSRGIIRGFQNFCLSKSWASRITYKDFEHVPVERATAYVVILDNDLVSLVKKIKEAGWEAGRQVGVLAYNDSPLKEVLLDGITVMSSRHKEMGSRLACMLTSNQPGTIENQFDLIVRQSL